jgi:hypothetical protein
MRFHARISFSALLTGVLIVVVAPAVAQGAGVENFYASNCKVSTCARVLGESPAEELTRAKAEAFTQAGGHTNFGITDFTIKTEGVFPNAAPEGIATGGSILTHIRTDVAPGVSTNPEAPAKCSFEEFGKEFEPAPGVHTHLYRAPTCGAESEIGLNDVVLYLGPKASPEGGDLPINNNKVYNLVQPKNLASDFGVAVKLPEALTDKLLGFPAGQLYAHTLIEGNVEWGAEAAGTGKADYHDYFDIPVSPLLPLISSRLIFKGNIGVGGFLTNPTSCTGTGPQTTTGLKLEFQKKGETAEAKYMTLVGNDGCAAVPFQPAFKLTQGTTASDQTDGLIAELTLPHDANPELPHVDSSQVKAATVALPNGITLNTSAASGLEACTPEEIGIGTKNPISCPAGSKLGTVTLNVPGLPEGSLQGNMYLGGPAGGGAITGPPYIIYVAAESKRYGVIVRVRGVTTPNETTGQLTTTFTENPEQPFSDLILHFNGGSRATLANGLACETSNATTSFAPFTATEAKAPTANFEVTGCGASVPFAPTQATSSEPAQAGGSSTYSLSFTRPEGNQYLAKVRDVLPPGLVGLIPTVTQCAEAAANAGTCTSASQIGTATVAAGSGSPYTFNGRVYLTGPYEGAPFGLSIVVPNVAGPFNLGNTIARVKIEVDQHTSQIIATDNNVPMIVKGIPIRMRSLNISINRQGFERNPTNCSAFNTESTLTGSLGTAVNVTSPFQAEGCSGLSFAPTFKVTTSAKTSKNNGASLEATINQPSGQANINSVLVSLPKTLPSRLTTLQKACPEATFAANPYSCPEGSLVGSARANTPTLPGKLQGPAYLVSHGGAAFPDLDLVLEANGVRVIVVGNTDIKNGITTTRFATTPDVPVSSITVLLPTGPHSALTAYGDVCKSPLYMPTTITAQNGKVFKQNTRIGVSNCGVKIVGQKVIGRTAYLTIRTFAPGRISGSGSNVSTVARNLGSAQSGTSLKVSLNGSGRSRRKPLRVKIRVGFLPRSKSFGNSVAYTTVTYR